MDLDIYDLEQRRLAFQNLFVHHPDGKTVLAIIRNELGANCYNPAGIKPELIAFDHWILNQIGIKHQLNVIEETAALLTAANDNDLVAVKKQRNKTEEAE